MNRRFVTFRLHGSLPPNRFFPPENVSSGSAFVALDRLLDQAPSGPVLLRQPEIALMVVKAIHDCEKRFERYRLHSFVVMPNHVHVLVTPHVNSTKWLGPLKGFTAWSANKILGRGGPFWQHESYDHLVKPGEFERIRRYIENNPVRAGLASEPHLFPWSSASQANASTQSATQS
jgi:putative transposase